MTAAALRAIGWIWVVLSAFVVFCVYLVSGDARLWGVLVVLMFALTPGVMLIGMACVLGRYCNRRHPGREREVVRSRG